MPQVIPSLQSTTYEFDDVLEVNEFYQEKGWTDGLPIVPPTALHVAVRVLRLPTWRRAMLSGSSACGGGVF